MTLELDAWLLSDSCLEQLFQLIATAMNISHNDKATCPKSNWLAAAEPSHHGAVRCLNIPSASRIKSCIDWNVRSLSDILMQIQFANLRNFVAMVFGPGSKDVPFVVFLMFCVGFKTAAPKPHSSTYISKISRRGIAFCSASLLLLIYQIGLTGPPVSIVPLWYNAHIRYTCFIQLTNAFTHLKYPKWCARCSSKTFAQLPLENTRGFHLYYGHRNALQTRSRESSKRPRFGSPKSIDFIHRFIAGSSLHPQCKSIMFRGHLYIYIFFFFAVTVQRCNI